MGAYSDRLNARLRRKKGNDMFLAEVKFWDGTENGYPIVSYRVANSVVTLDAINPNEKDGINPIGFRLAGGPGEQTIQECVITNAAGVPVKRIPGQPVKPREVAKPKLVEGGPEGAE